MYIYIYVFCFFNCMMEKIGLFMYIIYIYLIYTIFIIDCTCIHLFLHIRTCVVNAIMFLP